VKFGRGLRPQRQTHAALLREFTDEISESEVEPLAEAIRASLAGVALWWPTAPTSPAPCPAARFAA
jgi:hypothetical protein